MTAQLMDAQARTLLLSSIRKWGTEENTILTVACGVRKADCVEEFDAMLFRRMTTSEQSQYSDGIPGKPGRILSRIFQAELDGSDLSHAQDCLTLGRITHRDGRFEYFRDGVLDFFDFSSTSSKIGAAAMVGGLGLLCIVAPPIGIAVGTAVLVGTAAISGGAVIKNGIEIAVEDEASAREDWRDLGNATAGFVAAAAPLRPTIRFLTETYFIGVGPVMPFAGSRVPAFYTSPMRPVQQSTSVAPVAVELAQPIVPTIGVPVPPPIQATHALFYTTGNGGTLFYKIKIHWTNGKTSAFFWDRIDNTLLQIQGEHIVQPLPGMSTLVPELIMKIIARKPIPAVDTIRSIEVLEFNEYGAAQFRAARESAVN
jgi:hypothetical protein